MTDALRLSVIVPTICRPETLRTALASLASQSRPPDEIVVVLPTGTNECETVVAGAAERLPISTVRGSEAGIVEAVNLGLAAATGDVVALIDDDAEAPGHWLERIEAWFRDPRVGAIGGPHVPPGGTPADLPPVRRWDRLTWFGYSTPPRTDGRIDRPQPAHFLGESSLAFRREAVPAIDARLVGRDERFGDDVTLSLLRRGYRVVADPHLYVRHAHVRFSFDPDRVPNREHVHATAHNQTYLWLKHLPGWRRPVFLAFGLLVGDRAVKGLGAFVAWMAANVGRPRRAAAIARLVGPTIRGRIDGVRTYRKARGG